MKRIRGSRAPNPVAEPNPHGRILVTWALNHDCDCLEDKRTVLGGSRTVRHHCDAVGGGAVFLTYIAARPRRRVWSGEPRDALGYHHHDFGGLEQVATVSFVNNESKKITLAEMRPSGVRGGACFAPGGLTAPVLSLGGRSRFCARQHPAMSRVMEAFA